MAASPKRHGASVATSAAQARRVAGEGEAVRVERAASRGSRSVTYRVGDIPAIRSMVRYDPDSGQLYRLSGGAETLITKIPDTSNGYIPISVLGVTYRAHRLAWLLYFGAWPEGDIDHIDGNKLNNRLSNLRVASPRQNARNKRIPADHATGCVGVEKRIGRAGATKWRATIHFKARKIRLGQFDTIEQAIAARLKAEREHGYPSGQPRIDITKVLRVATEGDASESANRLAGVDDFPVHEDAL